MDSYSEELLDGHQQVVGQHAEEYVSLRPALQAVEVLLLTERALHRPELRLDPDAIKRLALLGIPI
jgi:hypothetical protein